VYQARDRVETNPLGHAQPAHAANHAVGHAAAADEQRLDHTQPANRAFQVVELGAIVGGRLDLGEWNLAHGPQRRIAEQFVDVVRRVPHAKPRRQALANCRRRRVVFVVFVYVVERVRSAVGEGVRSLLFSVSRLPREHIVLGELSDVCRGGMFGTNGIKMHAWCLLTR